MSVDPAVPRPLAWSEPGRTTLEIKTGGWRTRRPLYVEATAPCRAACPAGEPIARWIERARAGDLHDAWRLIREENPFPAVMGRVCAHPCETACNRGGFDGAVAINALERHVGDWGLAHATVSPAQAKRTERVAVVGGGPAGLACAYHLARFGYRVTVFEREAALGGLLRYGIPEYRLPRAVLDREIELVLGLGVDVETGRTLGDTLAWDDLARWDVVFLATGATVPLGLRVPGERARGVGDGLAFLHQVNAGGRPALGDRLVVVGGGSTAMDVARTARRLGVADVTVVALETRPAMPAIPDEVAQALAEGVTVLNETGVLSVAEHGGAVTGVGIGPATLQRTATGIVPVFGEGPRSVLPADAVLLAIGQRPDHGPLPPPLARSGSIVSVDEAGATTAPRVFAGGDVASLDRTVSHAVGSGTRAARAIHAALSGVTTGRFVETRGWTTGRAGHVVAFAEINLDHVRRAPRAARPELPAPERTRSFTEVVGALDGAAAAHEARRCFTCGHCIACDVCFLSCPDMAIARLEDGYRISLEHCKGCGVCAFECPRGALSMESER